LKSLLFTEGGKELKSFNYWFVESISSGKSHEFHDLLGQISPASLEQFQILTQLGDKILTQPKICPTLSSSIANCLLEYSFMNAPQILVIQPPAVSATNIRIDETVYINGHSYQLNSVLCESDVAFLRDGPILIRLTSDNCQKVESITGQIRFVIYERNPIPQNRELHEFAVNSPTNIVVSRLLHSSLVNWGHFLKNETFKNSILQLLGKFRIPRLFELVKHDSGIAYDLFGLNSHLLRDEGFVKACECYILEFARAIEDPLGIFLEMLDADTASADLTLKIFAALRLPDGFLMEAVDNVRALDNLCLSHQFPDFLASIFVRLNSQSQEEFK
jgi:hypothetical protein